MSGRWKLERGGDRGKGEAIEGKGVIKGKEYDRGEMGAIERRRRKRGRGR